jgi:hypothetical protein
MRKLWNSATGIGDAATVLVILILATLFLTAQAFAQQPPQPPRQQMCGPFGQMREQLASQYRETEIGTGMIGEGTALLMLFASPDGKTWTILQLSPQGVACVAAAGTDWDAGQMPRNDERGA